MSVARKTFELHNDVQTIDLAEELYKYSREGEQALENAEPWKTDPHYFHTVKISAIALIKMVTHARSGGIYEIMGVMYGKVRDHTFWIMDAAALPVQGTETRVNAGNEASEYMVQYQMASDDIGRGERLRGWYHSHPGYGCWLSGIDVNTQMNNQNFNDPYLAVVIDPNRTVSAGKVEIGAFRTYPQGYTPPSAGTSSYQTIPVDKIEDFGAHANAYYPLKVEIYKSKLDEQMLELLWNKYWVSTLSSSQVISNRAYEASQITDLATKLNTVAHSLNKNVSKLEVETPDARDAKGKGVKNDRSYSVEDEATPLNKAATDSSRIAAESRNGLVGQVLKDRLFNTPLDQTLSRETAEAATRGALEA